MSEIKGYIMRIATKEWVNQVFDLAMYYTSIHRKMSTGQTILFINKTELGDAFIGYGEIENIYSIDVLSEEEKRKCEKHGWKKALEFKYIIKFDKPLPLKETFVKELKLRGKSLHGFPLKSKQVNEIVRQAEQLSS